MTDLDSPRRNNDCYFYYYSTCTKGDSCTFRHEPSALGCETMCSFWKEGKCLNVHCNYRHMELRKNRKAIQCYWENQPGGCLKPHCPFLHQNVGQSSANLDDNTNTNANNSNSTEETENTEEVSQSPTQNGIEGQSSERNFRNQVDSLVVSFEEESDTESIPTKSPSKLPVKKLRVKTLEEIKLERIQEESAAYFAYSLDHPDNDKGEDLRRNLMRKRKRNAQDDPQKLSKISRLDAFIPHTGETYINPKDFNLFSKINNNGQENKEDETISDIRDHKITRLGIKNKVIRKNTQKVLKELDTIKIKTLEEIRAEKRRKQAEMNSKVSATVLVAEISSTTKDEDESRQKETVPAKPITPKKKVKLIRLASTDLKELVENDSSKIQEDKSKEQTQQNDQDLKERLPTSVEEDAEKSSALQADSEASSVQSSNPQKSTTGNGSIEYPEEMLLLGEDLDYEDDGLMNEIDSILSK
ncbi:zinc finger CCCH domain-containing protein 11B-like isoform X2 [Coccinella septempunctata]|nr:zinc finger CCCH domain-containing protein 11B-like isoform X2 [Coccinella septempunctata]